ncbi:MAG: hypothetical protein K5985_10150 [Lachnospiraceae bacterium]|nr:hypothetical protein [Lachnospiraceae bacterium]
MAQEEIPALEDSEQKGKKPKKDKKKDKKKGKDQEGMENLEEDDEDSGLLSVILVTVFIVMIWLAILALLIKLDVGGFGSNVATPILKNVPGVNRILPGYSLTASGNGIPGEEDQYAGYDNVEDAVARIKELETTLLLEEEELSATRQSLADLQEENSRLATFRDNQVAFEKIRDEYYNEVVFGDNAPDINEYRKFYEQIDPVNAEILYKQVVAKEQADEELQNYAKAYSAMKAKQAAGIFESQVMRGDIRLSAKILGAMGADARGAILGAMDAEVAGQITEVMEPAENSTEVPSSAAEPYIPSIPETPEPEETASDNSASSNTAP